MGDNFPTPDYEPYCTPLGDVTTFTSDIQVKRGIVVGTVKEIITDPISNTQRVKVDTSWGNCAELITAKILSPYTDEFGHGIVCGIKKNTKCVVASARRSAGGVPEYVVLGFYQTQPLHLLESVNTGDIHLRSENNGKIALFSFGDILVEANEKCFTMWDTEESDITTEVRTSHLSTFAGKERWEHSKADDTKDETLRSVEVARKIDTKTQYVEQQGALKAADESAVTSRRRAYEASSFDKDNPTNSVVFMEEIAEDGSYTIEVADKATVTIDASNGTVRIEIPDKALIEMSGDDKTILLEQANSGASVKLDASGNVYVTAGGGKNVHLNDSAGTAQGVARVGDAVNVSASLTSFMASTVTALSSVAAATIPPTVIVPPVPPTTSVGALYEGSSTVKSG